MRTAYRGQKQKRVARSYSLQKVFGVRLWVSSYDLPRYLERAQGSKKKKQQKAGKEQDGGDEEARIA